jgi:2-oxoglutarate ferredoxin oxidoreductase subunit alpha
VGGLEKADRTGNISYDPDNHDFMTRTRQAKIDGIAATLPPTEVDDPDGTARVAVIGWGSTYGPIGAACRQIRSSGRSIAQIHLRHLNPMPSDLGKILSGYDRIICPEMNMGQLAMLLRARYLVDVQSHTQVRGLPFRAAELAAVFQDAIDAVGPVPAEPARLATVPTGEAS